MGGPGLGRDGNPPRTEQKLILNTTVTHQTTESGDYMNITGEPEFFRTPLNTSTIKTDFQDL